MTPDLQTPDLAESRERAAAAFEAGNAAEGHDLLRAAVAGSIDLEALNDLAVLAHAAGREQEARAILDAVLAIDADSADAKENRDALRDLEAQAGAAWRQSRTIGGDDPGMWERAFPGMPRPDVVCEHTSRYALAIGLVGGQHVLDLGCGTAYGSEMLSWVATSVRGYDIWQPGDHERPTWPGPYALNYGHDLCKDPLPAAEAAVMFEVIEHLPDAPAALALAWDAVDTIIASFPNPVHHGSHMNQWHVNDWTLDEFDREVKDAAGRFVALEHFHQPLGSVLLHPGRDPEASFWVVVAQAGPKLLKSR
jgi:hypothetical protein